MPDWLIHLGATYAVGRPVRRWDPRWLFLGAVLPDLVPRVAGSAIATMDWLAPLREPAVGLYLAFLHTPLSVGLLALAVGVFAADRREAGRGLLFGSAIHLVLDLCQRTLGGGMNLLYPFDLHPFSLQLAWYENPLTYALAPLFGAALLWIAWQQRRVVRPPVFARPTGRGLLVAVAALAVTFVTPLFCLERAVEANINATGLAAHPDQYEGRQVGLAVALVAEVGPDEVKLEVNDVLFGVPRASLPTVEVDDRASVMGVYRSGRIEPTDSFVHDYDFKRAVSIAGLLLLVLFWFPASWVRRWPKSRS